MQWYKRWRTGKVESLVAKVKLPKFACIIIGHKRVHTPHEVWEAMGMAAVCRLCGKGYGRSGKWDIPDGLERLAQWEAAEGGRKGKAEASEEQS